jgi:hypothetical protein
METTAGFEPASGRLEADRSAPLSYVVMRRPARCRPRDDASEVAGGTARIQARGGRNSPLGTAEEDGTGGGPELTPNGFLARLTAVLEIW